MTIPVQNGDILRVRTATQLSSTTLYVTICMRDQNGRYTSWHEAVPISSSFTIVTKDIPLPAGTLEKVACSTTDANALAADLYASVTLHHQDPDTDPVGVPLLSGYVTRLKPVIYPGSPPQGPLEGPGSLVSVSTSGSVGSMEVIRSVPSNCVERLVGEGVEISTDATVANRYLVRVITRTAVDSYFAYVSTVAQPASSVYRYFFGRGYGELHDGSSVLPNISLPLPSEPLLPGYEHRYQVVNIQAGDQITDIDTLVERWIYL